MTTVLSQPGPQPAAESTSPPRADRVVLGLMEALLLAMVVVAPWWFGAVEPDAELALYAGLAALLALWGVRGLLAGRLTWRHCPVALCLAGLFLLAVVQLAPLPRETLAWLSPATARLYDEQLPAQPEVLAEGYDWRGDLPPAGTTLSICPAATRQEALRLLAVVLLYVVVRNNLTGERRLRRLAGVALANGALLALVALLQFFTSRHDVVYWHWKSQGTVFGPFICRNHFPFYANLCLGLGLGLWLASQTPPVRGREARHAPPWSPHDLLREPLLLWLAAGLGLVLTGVLFSLSRGGFVALLGAAALCLVLKLLRAPRPGRLAGPLGGAFLALALAAGVVYGFGQDQVTGRLASLWEGQALEEGRGPLWERAFAVARDFPVFGTGFGTFQYAELTRRTSASDANLYYVNAHNDYLDALAEGGVLRLGLGLLAIALVLVIGSRALRRNPVTAGLAWGLLFAFGTLVIHSFADFGIHLPAVAVLATVLCAHLVSLGDKTDDAPRNLGGLAPLAGVVVALSLGLVLVTSGWEAYREQSLRQAAAGLKDQTDADSLDRRVALVQQAARLAPDHAATQLDLARAYRDRWHRQTDALERTYKVQEAALVLLGPTALPGFPLVTGPWSEDVRGRLHRAALAEATGPDLLPALACTLRARDACPWQDEANLELARYARSLPSADRPETYLVRAQRAAPANPLVWLLSGQQEAAGGYFDRAQSDWRRSLELSDRYLPQVLDEGSRFIAPEELLEKAVPDDPSLLWRAARRLYPDSVADRAPALRRALALLDERGDALDGPGFVVKAAVNEELGRLPAAAAAWRKALEHEPLRTAWRYELARVLYENHQGREASRELERILGRHPRDAAALALMQRVRRLIAEKE